MGKTGTLLQAKMAGDRLPAFCCQPCYEGSWYPPPSQAREWRGSGPAIGGHSPALGEQGLRGAKLFEHDPAQLYCLLPYLFSSSRSNVNVTCALRAKLPFMASAAKKADKPEHLRLQSPLLHKRQGQTENMCFIFANLNDLY